MRLKVLRNSALRRGRFWDPPRWMELVGGQSVPVHLLPSGLPSRHRHKLLPRLGSAFGACGYRPADGSAPLEGIPELGLR